MIPPAINRDWLRDSQAFDFPSGKAAALRWLAPRLRTATIPPLVWTSVDDWRGNRTGFLTTCSSVFHRQVLAVRSDASAEAGTDESSAGKFLTLLNVRPAELQGALDRVTDGLPGHELDGVFVQAMAPDVALAGVASTHRIADGAPYYCLELAADECAVVTAGKAEVQQIALARSARTDAVTIACLTAAERSVLAMLREVEGLCGELPIEIEFALGDDGDGGLKAFLLQVRTLAGRWRPKPAMPATSMIPPTPTSPAMPDLGFLRERDPMSRIAGRRTVLSLMSDWNPAELIGSHPRPLARSLFERLICSGTWWQARADIGYERAPMPDVALLHVVHGRPFIDVRRSANSLLPRGLDSRIAGQVVDGWIERLHLQPALHDKVEFAVFRTIRDFTAQEDIRRDWATELTGVSWQAWDDALFCLTRSIIDQGPRSPLAKYVSLLNRLDAIGSDGSAWTGLIQLAGRCARAFAVLARIAFAGEAQLRSAILRSALTGERATELRAAARGESSRAKSETSADRLRARFGHLRPGTFDILQKTWAADGCLVDPHSAGSAPQFRLRSSERRNIDLLLRESGMAVDADMWVHIVQASAAAREQGKFVCSRFLSHALDGISSVVDQTGLDDEHASWLTVDQLLSAMRLDAKHRRGTWRRQAEEASQLHRAESMLMISPVLRDDSDRFIARSIGTLPNFVGHRIAAGTVVVLDSPAARRTADLRGAIVVLSRADPGFDWLFDAGIAGLLTAWGGANSHLAIRCAEAGIPAAIGCGEAVFEKARVARHARIDAGGGGLWLT